MPGRQAVDGVSLWHDGNGSPPARTTPTRQERGSTGVDLSATGYVLTVMRGLRAGDQEVSQ
ncbi:hypothetical protein GCM10010169_33140 [Micromonospora fulviviridis]|nr:hypothetical protein GCM10010169_33140 [Micromonospora fulviviridis]